MVAPARPDAAVTKLPVQAVAKVYGLMSDKGSHPYIADRDQARCMRYLSLTFAQFVLLRFHRWAAGPK